MQARWVTLLAMCVATFMLSLDVTIVNVALPSIQRELHMSAGDLEWVISAYALGLAAFVPAGAVPRPQLCRASGISLVSYASLGGVLFFMTLLYQDASGWSVLRTGLSWLFMNAPFLLMAQFAGRLDRRIGFARRPSPAVQASGSRSPTQSRAQKVSE